VSVILSNHVTSRFHILIFHLPNHIPEIIKDDSRLSIRLIINSRSSTASARGESLVALSTLGRTYDHSDDETDNV